jgi:asparagine synthase (glutamine-hydrolysing)
LARAADEPLADLASVPLYYVCRLARQHVKAVLSGEGSDEVLAGYDLERSAARVRWLRRVDRSVPRPLLALAGRLAPLRHATSLRALAQGGLAGYMGARASHITFEWDEAEKRALWRTHPDAGSTEDLIRSWYGQTTSSEPIDQVQEVMIGSWLVEDLLMKADKMSMANSLELREPFLDHALVEWAARLPLAWKTGDARTGPVSKRVLREFCRGRLPEAILTRPKQGFPVPAYRWLAGPLATWSRDLVLGPEARLLRLFQRLRLQATAWPHAASGC